MVKRTARTTQLDLFQTSVSISGFLFLVFYDDDCFDSVYMYATTVNACEREAVPVHSDDVIWHRAQVQGMARPRVNICPACCHSHFKTFFQRSARLSSAAVDRTRLENKRARAIWLVLFGWDERRRGCLVHLYRRQKNVWRHTWPALSLLSARFPVVARTKRRKKIGKEIQWLFQVPSSNSFAPGTWFMSTTTAHRVISDSDDVVQRGHQRTKITAHS